MQVSQEAGKVVWYSHLFSNFPQFVVIHSVKGFSVVSEVEVDVFPWYIKCRTQVYIKTKQQNSNSC